MKNEYPNKKDMDALWAAAKKSANKQIVPITRETLEAVIMSRLIAFLFGALFGSVMTVIILKLWGILWL